MSTLEVVIPITPEAEQLAEMMNKQIAAFLLNYLKDIGMPGEFVTRLVNKSISPDLCHKAVRCEWTASLKLSQPLKTKNCRTN